VERIVPVTETQPQKSRRGIYRLKDHYLRFWFRYVHPYRSQLERGNAQAILENQVMPEIDHFASLTFEEVCEQYFWLSGLSGKLTFIPTKIGNWWNANEEIDLVVLGEVDAILVECKWTSKPIGIDILEDLQRKGKIIQSELENRQIHFALCSRSGFTYQLIEGAKQRQDILLLNLNEIVS
jgi:AAA+ ATPase superfamily predicted ATPase